MNDQEGRTCWIGYKMTSFRMLDYLLCQLVENAAFRKRVVVLDFKLFSGPKMLVDYLELNIFLIFNY